MGITVFDPITGLATLVNSFLAGNSGISVVDGSIGLHLSGAGAVSLYDAAVGTPLGIGGGLLLTSGTTPGTSNTSTWYGADNSGSSGFYNGDADIDAVVNTVFQTQSYDATTLSFKFTVSDPQATSISFDLVFGSDEYPEWVDAFVDCAVVIVDGVNYALFNNDPLHPLSVISPNLAAGYFQDNAGNSLPIEYDGVSSRLRIVAPLNSALSTHTIKIGIADTGDHILDSGLFIANLSAGTNPGSGVVSNPGGGTSGNDTCTGSSKDEYFDLLAGDDTVYAGGGADIIVAGSGNDQVYAGSGNDELKGDAGDDLLDGGADLDTAVYAGASGAYSISLNTTTGQYSISGNGEGLDTLVSIEQLKFSDGLFSLSNDGTTAKLTAVTQPPPPPSNTAGLLMISGLAAVGSTLTATVADVDGLPTAAGAITWQWYSDLGAIGGATAATYKLQAADSNHCIWVQASYTDAKGILEAPSSNSVFVKPLSIDGELTATPMTIEGPTSASVNTPITTLLLRAVELGEAPYSAIQKIRSALGVPTAVGSLLSTNAFQILQSGVGDTATALALAKLEVEVAVLCTVSDDQSGMKLALALLNKAASGGSFDLTKASDVAVILGLDLTTINLNDKTTWPKSLQEIFDRTNNIHDALKLFDSSTSSGFSIESEWRDFFSNWDALKNNVVPLSSLSLAINQAPTGFATAALPSFVAGETASFLLTTAQLTQGFQDPDGDMLTVNGLTTDRGDWFNDNGDGTWSINPAAAGYDASYLGPLELSYTIDDGHNHSLDVTQLLLVVDHINHTPVGAVTINGTPTQGQTLIAANTLVDADGLGVITYQWRASGSGTVIGTGSTYILTQAEVGKTITVTASFVDGLGQPESVDSDVTATIANVDDAATGTLNISGIAQEGGSLSSSFSSLSDPDGSIVAMAFQWQELNGSTWINLSGQNAANLSIPSDQSYVGKTIRLVATTSDVLGGSTSFTGASQTIANVNDAPTGEVTISGTAAQGQTLSAAQSLADSDGLGTITYQWNANHTAIPGATGSTYLLTEADVGQVISVTASYIDSFSTAESVTSLPTAPIAPPVDATPPKITGITVAGNQVSIRFSEAIHQTNLPTAARFTVKVAGVAAILSGAPTAVTGDPTRLLLTLTSTPSSTQTVSVAYTDLSAGNDISGVVQDTAGNDMATTTAINADTFSSSANVSSLAAAYSTLILTGSTAINGTGNASANTISGNSAVNVITGGGGTDSMDGGGSGDIYLIASSNDHTSAEIHDTGSSGTDELRFTSTTANQTISVYADDTGLERVVIGTGTTATADTKGSTALNINASAAPNALIITGNNGNNSLSGTVFADTITGNGGNDTLSGGLGNDTLTGGTGADVFRFDSTLNATTNVDCITDFSLNQADRIQLENAVFAELTTTGTLATTAFVSATAFSTATQRIRYESLTGNLFYDPDGNGVGASVLFATLSTGLAMTNAQFVVT